MTDPRNCLLARLEKAHLLIGHDEPREHNAVRRKIADGFIAAYRRGEHQMHAAVLKELGRDALQTFITFLVERKRPRSETEAQMAVATIRLGLKALQEAGFGGATR